MYSHIYLFFLLAFCHDYCNYMDICVLGRPDLKFWTNNSLASTGLCEDNFEIDSYTTSSRLSLKREKYPIDYRKTVTVPQDEDDIDLEDAASLKRGNYSIEYREV